MEAFLEKHKIKDSVIAVGVSGGADSLALALKAKEELAVFGRKIVALTVNHQLRPSALQEALYVAEVMKKNGIEHHILTWEGTKPQTGIEEAARNARYALIEEWCIQNNVRVLLTAHHLYDQAETFLMRLNRGSGLDGLCCMRECVTHGKLLVLRPLLHTNPEEMRRYLKAKNIAWVEDESNKDDKFLRARIRKFLPEFMEKTGITLEKIDTAVTNLQSAENFIEEKVAQTFALQIMEEQGNVKYFNYTDYLSWSKELRFRVLASLCQNGYIPRADSVMQLADNLGKLPFNGATLGGREIFLMYGKVWIVPELNSKRKNSRKAWKIIEQKYPEYKNKKLPHKVKTAIVQALEMGCDCL